MGSIQTEPLGCIVGALICQKDSYLRALEAKVISCIKAPEVKPPKSKGKSKGNTDVQDGDSICSDIWHIEFNDSVLFPEGGGQPSDQGTLTILDQPEAEPITIKFVERQGLRCIYHSPKPIEPGTRVVQTINHPLRWDHMQQHTGQHLLSNIMETHYSGLETLGWSMGKMNEVNYVELPRKPTDEEMASIQDRCNEEIRQNHVISVEVPEDAKTDKMPGDYDREKGIVRVIRIGNLDRDTCCGTHLRQTSHISLILLHNTQPIRGTNTRLYFSCGDRAIKFATSSVRSLRSIAGMLSSKTEAEEVLSAVQRIAESEKEGKRRENKLLAEIAKYEGERVKAILAAGKKALVYRSEPGLYFLDLVTIEIRDALKDGGLVVLASGQSKTAGQVVIHGEKGAVEEMATKVKEAVSGLKGGGRGEKWQGKVVEWKKGEVEMLRKLVEGEELVLR
ncbi:Threonyl/alanyl tRNA synthetase [Tricladium varicosporioides]|nr:Threonyl/alanyl tRNA synthetase [Hymenoscyphus varicosporioides]